MQGFFSSAIVFWYTFVYLFLLCGSLTAVIQCYFIIHFTNAKARKTDYIIYLVVFLSLSAGEIQWKISPWISTTVGLIMIYGFTHFLLKKNYLTSAVVGMLTITVDVLIEGIGAPILNMLSRFFNTPFIYIGLNIVASIGTLVAACFIYLYLIKNFKMKLGGLNQYLLVIVVPLLLIIILIRLVLHMGYTGQIICDEKGIKNHNIFSDYQMLIISVLAFICTIVSLLAFQKIMNYFEVEKKKARLEQQLSVQESYTQEAMLRYDLTRSFRHDLKNHIIVLKGLIENSQIEKAINYLDSFEQAAEKLTFQIHTGNAAVDVLFSDKLALARQSGIDIRCDVDIPKDINVNDFDLCIILSNAIDNAIQACRQIEEGEKWIDIKAKKNNDFFIIDIMNSYSNKAKEKRGTGMGLPNINTVVEEYSGIVNVKKTDETYIMTILLVLNQQE